MSICHVETGGQSRSTEGHAAFGSRKDRQRAPGAGIRLVAGASWERGEAGQTLEAQGSQREGWEWGYDEKHLYRWSVTRGTTMT